MTIEDSSPSGSALQALVDVRAVGPSVDRPAGPCSRECSARSCDGYRSRSALDKGFRVTTDTATEAVADRRHGRRDVMRILLVGAGGVGGAIVAIAARRAVLRGHGRRRLRPGPGRAGRRARVGDAALHRRRGSTRPTRPRSRRCCAEHRCDVLLNAIDPRFVMPIFRAALAAGADYLDMAMSLSQPHPDATRTQQTGVKLGDEQFALRRRVGGGRPAGARRHGRRARAVRRVRPLRRRPPVQRDRRARHPRRREPGRRRATTSRRRSRSGPRSRSA